MSTVKYTGTHTANRKNKQIGKSECTSWIAVWGLHYQDDVCLWINTYQGFPHNPHVTDNLLCESAFIRRVIDKFGPKVKGVNFRKPRIFFQQSASKFTHLVHLLWRKKIHSSGDVIIMIKTDEHWAPSLSWGSLKIPNQVNEAGVE